MGKRSATTATAVIELWPSAEIFADDIGLKHRSHGRVMKLRDSIPRKHWPRVARAASRRRLPVTIELLEAIHNKRG